MKKSKVVLCLIFIIICIVAICLLCKNRIFSNKENIQEVENIDDLADNENNNEIIEEKTNNNSDLNIKVQTENLNYYINSNWRQSEEVGELENSKVKISSKYYYPEDGMYIRILNGEDSKIKASDNAEIKYYEEFGYDNNYEKVSKDIINQKTYTVFERKDEFVKFNLNTISYEYVKDGKIYLFEICA